MFIDLLQYIPQFASLRAFSRLSTSQYHNHDKHQISSTVNISRAPSYGEEC